MLIEFLISDFFNCFDSSTNKFNVCDDDSSINIYTKDNKFFSPNAGETKKDFTNRIGIAWRDLLNNAKYIEYVNPCDIQLWCKDSKFIEYNGWIEKC